MPDKDPRQISEITNGIVMSPNNASNVSQSLQEATDAPGEAGTANDQDHGSGASGRMDESAGLHSSPDAKRADTPVIETVHTPEPAVAKGIRGYYGAANVRMGYGKLDSKQGVHMPPPAPAAYTCEDCLDLERRVRKAFKEQGVEF